MHLARTLRSVPFSGLFPLLLCLAFFALGCEKTQAQVLISGNFQNIPLSEALKSVEQSSGMIISYDPALVRNISVQVSFRNKSPQDAFDLLLKDTPFSADIMSSRYVVLRKKIETPQTPTLITLCGQIQDAATREALAHATIGFTRPGFQTHTDLEGNFTIRAPAPIQKEDQIIVRYLGYKTLYLPAADFLKTPCLQISMSPGNTALMEIVVTDRALEPIDVGKQGAANTQLRPDRAGFVPALGEPDPFRMLQLLPGIASNGDKAGELIVRGGSSDQNLVLWEGIPIYHTGHLFGVVSALNPYVVNRVNIWKGNFGAEQGGRASCMIDMRSEPSALQKTRYSIGLNLLSAYFSIESPLFRKKGGMLFAARGAFSDLIKNKAYQQLFGFATQNSAISNDVKNQQRDSFLRHAIRIIPVSAFNDANFKIYYQPNERTRMELSAYSGSDVLRYRVDYNVPSWQFT
ncbi:MAG: carboxypeptidase-like regulatory domain-containing protein [Bacteroidetes bacterium]|nr:carboxypeptidase-like regulatory domain-containing protein [Bacteroidota bacterium]